MERRRGIQEVAGVHIEPHVLLQYLLEPGTNGANAVPDGPVAL